MSINIGVRKTRGSVEITKKSIFYLILVLYLVISAIPFAWSILTSVKTLGAANAHTVFSPIDWTAWKDVLTQADFPRWFLNSVIVAALVAIGNLFFDSLAGFAFARLPLAIFLCAFVFAFICFAAD